MKLTSDISSPRTLVLKGLLFFILGTLSAGLLLFDLFTLKHTALLAITIWAFCRFYYFLFYVLEHYAGRKRPYAGLLDLLTSLSKK